jgi:excisionase family DNA binding protein
MAQIMTTKELSQYLKLHLVIMCKFAGEGKIFAIRIGRVWRFLKDAIDQWTGGDQNKTGIRLLVQNLISSNYTGSIIIVGR